MFDLITELIARTGLFGIMLLMFLENVFPPIPSELIMPLAGYNVANGRMSLVPVILAGSAGALAGAWLWYWAAMLIPQQRIEALVRRFGHWLGLDVATLRLARRWFRRFGPLAVLFGRMMPGLRTLISVPAGLVRMRLPVFLLFSGIGTVIWVTGLTLTGYLLDAHYDRIAGWLDPLTWVILGASLAAWLWRVLRHRNR